MHSAAPLFDAHNHLQDEWLLPYRQTIFSDFARINIKACVVNGTSESDWADVAALARTHEMVIPSFGLHPWDVGNRTPEWQARFLDALQNTPNAFVGEIGLDRWMIDHARADDPRLHGLRRAPLNEQIEAFRWQLMVAAERNLPASIHCLEAFGPLLDVLSSTPLPRRGFLLHAYSGSIEMAAAFAKLGAYFSFNGAFLEPRKQSRRDVFAQIPGDRLLVETDAPAMCLTPALEIFKLPPTPEGHQINHPGNAVSAYDGLARLRRTTTDCLVTQVAENFRRLFGS